MDRQEAVQLLSAQTQTGTSPLVGDVQMPEQITAAAYQDDEGTVYTGDNHPQILQRLDVRGYDTPESRNTPQFGFQTTKRPFITREEAGPVATASGQNLKTFEPGEPVHSDEVAQPGTNKPIGDGLTPQTSKALDELVSSSREGPLVKAERQRKEQYISQTKEPGVSLDIETGVSPWEKFVMGFQREKATQISYLQNKYGEENVRQDAQGGLIVRVLDTDTGKPKDLKVDEFNMSAKDLLELAGSVPEVAAGVVATLKGRQLPKVGALRGVMGLQRDIAATAAGAEGVGGLKDLLANITVKGPSGAEDVPQIAKERAAMAAGDVAVGEVTMGLGRALNFMKAPLAGSRGPVQFDALAAQKYFREKYGINVPLSIGESTGSPLFSRTEAFMEKLPGGGTPFKELKGQQEEALRQLQNIMMGHEPPGAADYNEYQRLVKSIKGKTLNEARAISQQIEDIKNKYGGKPPPAPRPTTDESVGKKLIDDLMQKIAPVETGIEGAAKTLGKVGTKQIENIIASATGPERQIFQSEAGKEIRDAVVAKRDAAKAEADRLFEEVRSAPGGSGKVFDGTGLKLSFRGILKSLPSAETTTQVPTGVLGPTGAPIMRTVQGKELMKEFVPPNIVSRLRSVIDLKNPKFSLQDLQQMRREVYDDIAKGEGVPGLGTHYLNDIGKAITSAIDNGIAGLPEGDLRAALDAANKHYKEQVIPFNRIGLTELFREADEPGRIADSEVVSRLFSSGKGSERYAMMKETLGAGSPAFDKLKRAMADRILADSRIAGDTLIDPKKLVQNLTALRTDTPEIAADMFGGKINEMFRQAKFLEYARGAKIDAGELQSLLKDKSPTASAFKALIDSEAQRDELYKNQILRDVANGSLPNKPINPTEFTNRFLDSAKPDDVKQVMYMIRGNPGLVEDIRSKTVEKMFRDASRSATPGDINKLMAGDPTRIVTGTSVFKQMESPDVRKKVESILGPDVFRDLSQYISLEAAGEAKETAFKAAGGLAAGMQIANLTRRGPLRYLYEAGKDWVVASLLTREPLRAWLSRVPTSMDPGAVSLLISSPPFLEAVAKDFPGVKGAAFVTALKNSVDHWTKEQSKLPKQQPDSEDVRLQNKRRSAEQLLETPQTNR